MGIKKFLSVVMASTVLFGATSIASAVEFKFSGTFNIASEYRRNAALSENYPNSFGVMQRFRPVLTATINENLYAVLGLEIGTSYWGEMGKGASLGADEMNIKVKHAYINWKMPGLTNMNIRMGIQAVKSPSATFGSPVIDNDAAGIAINYAITQNVGLNVTWIRPFVPMGISIDLSSNAPGNSDEFTGNQAVDYFQFELPLNFSGVSITPWGSILSISSQANKELGMANADFDVATGTYGPTSRGALGNKVGNGLLNNHLYVGGDVAPPAGELEVNQYFSTGKGLVWWAGITAKITAVENLTIGLDFTYGGTDYDKNTNATTNPLGFDPNREGYFVALNIKYKLESFTPGISYWYASGNKSNARKDGGGIMPSLGGSYSPILYAYDTSAVGIGACNDLGGVYTGSQQGVVLEAADITFIKDLTHVLQLAYVTGTTENGFLDKDGASTDFDPNTLTKNDQLVAVNFGTTYQIYENFTTTFAVGYIHALKRNDKWADKASLADDDVAVGIGFQYKF